VMKPRIKLPSSAVLPKRHFFKEARTGTPDPCPH
jgi:hypothetical protein